MVATDATSVVPSLGVGSASFRCNSGSYSVQASPAPTCVAACAAATLTWTVAGTDCEGTVPVTSFGATAVATDVTSSPTTGTGGATFTCNAGVWSAGASTTCSAETAPTNLILAHTTRRRNFTVSWTAGSGNGGPGGCKLQYHRNGTTWTDLAGTYNCDANTTTAAANLPSADGWTNNFNGTGVQVRLVRVSDGTEMGVFGTRTTCTASGGSSSATPTIDENCNHQWDDSVAGGTSQYSQGWSGGGGGGCRALTSGMEWTCPATCADDQDNDGNADTFHSAEVRLDGLNLTFTRYLSSPICNPANLDSTVTVNCIYNTYAGVTNGDLSTATGLKFYTMCGIASWGWGADRLSEVNSGCMLNGGSSFTVTGAMPASIAAGGVVYCNYNYTVTTYY